MPGNISGALQRPMKHAAMEAKCGPLFGFCPENTPLFGHLAPTSQAATLGQASPIGQASPARQASPIGQADARTQTRKLDSGSQTIQPPESAQPLESAAHTIGMIPSHAAGRAGAAPTETDPPVASVDRAGWLVIAVLVAMAADAALIAWLMFG